MPKDDRNYHVYFVASKSRTLYCGVTSDIRLRVMQHKDGVFPGFTSQYKCTRLVWFEQFEGVESAIDREKQLKRWRREKKVALIERMNPTWEDLSEGWLEKTPGPSTALPTPAHKDRVPGTPVRSGRDDTS